MLGHCTFRRPLLLGTLLAAMAAPGMAQHLVDTGVGTPPAAPCTVPPTGADWFSPAGPATLPTMSAPATDASSVPITTLHFADNLRPTNPWSDNEGTAVAAAAGAALMLAGAWRWFRSSRLPWPADPAIVPPQTMASDAGAQEAGDATGWRLSRFDDLPEPLPSEELRPIRPLYESLDEDDVIDVEPVASYP